MTSAPAIRQARAGDIVACAAIKNAWIDATPWMPRVHPAKDMERHYQEDVFPYQMVFVAENVGIQGFLALAETEVTSLFVIAPARGQGIGAALVDRAKAERDELRLWTFQANEGALRFYARHGFVEEARTDGDNEEGLPDVRMRWPEGSA